MLTSKRETFCQGIANGLNQSDSYRMSHDASGMKPATLWDEASKLAAVPEVSQRIAELKQANQLRLAEKHDWDADRFIHEAETNLRIGRYTSQVTAANGALKLIGDATGLLQAPRQVGDVNITKVTVILNHGDRKRQEVLDTEGSVVDE